MDIRESSGSRHAKPTPSVRRGPIVVLAALWLLGFVLIAGVHLNERWDVGTQLAVTAAVITLGTLATLLWFALCAPVSRRLRIGVAVAAFALLTLLAALFRLEEVTGGMRPRFVWRWAPQADRILKPLPVPAADANATANLSVTTANDFPRFLGTDGRQSVDGVSFDTNWSAAPPRCLWRQPIGAGWSSFAAVNGFAVTLEQRDKEELVTCYEISTGKLAWANGIETRHETVLGGVGPRSTPCIDGGRVYALGATGHFRCLDGATGAEIWRVDLLKETGVTNDQSEIAWGRAGSPLIVDELVVIPVGGPSDGPKISLAAYNKHTGDRIWTAGTRQISYASPVRATLLGRDQILIVLEDHAAGFDAKTGETLWEHPWPGRSNANASASNAVPVPPDGVFLSKGYGQGAELVRLTSDGNRGWRTESVWQSRVTMKTKFSNVVLFEGHVYGLDDVVLECIEVETGRRRWKRGRYGYGQLLRAGDVLIVLSESGELAAVKATPDRYEELGRFPALEGKSWNNPCLYGPYLLVRNSAEAACYELPGWSNSSLARESAPNVSQRPFGPTLPARPTAIRR